MKEFDRIRDETAPYVNERIDREAEGRIAFLKNQGHDAIIKRLAELEREWDVDRAVMANFAIVGGAAFTAGIKGRKGWLYFFSSQVAFLLLHAVKGWCPPTTVFRRLGFRSRQEIDAEKFALLDFLKNEERGEVHGAA